MNNKQILSKLAKIVNNQKQILYKLAQVVDNNESADLALQDFIKYQLVSWGLPREIAAKEYHTAERISGSKHYDVNITLTLADKSKKSLAENPTNGFSAWLTSKFTKASNEAKWKALEGFTATFKVTAN